MWKTPFPHQITHIVTNTCAYSLRKEHLVELCHPLAALFRIFVALFHNLLMMTLT